MRPFLSGIVAGYGVAVPVGAIGILIIETGLRNGLRKGLAAGAGAATADLIYAVVAVIGGAGAAAAIGDIGPGFRYVGGVVLVVMALLGIRRAIRQDGVVERGAGRTYAAFLGLTLVNPMTVLYFAAVVMGLGLATGMTPVEGIAFIAGAAVASLSWQWLLAFGGFTLGSRLSERARRWLAVAGNLLVLGLAVTIFLG